MEIGYNGQDATVLEPLSRPVHVAERSRTAMPDLHPNKPGYYDNIPTPKMSPRQIARFWALVHVTGAEDCWLWSGTLNERGYGRISIARRRYQAHRVAWEITHGPIARGMVVDHLCRNTMCVNPHHLEPVTQQVNTHRGVGPTAKHAAKTHCAHGHELTPENTRIRRGRRECRQCIKRWDAISWQRGTRSRGQKRG